jgi:hypothetical protein
MGNVLIDLCISCVIKVMPKLQLRNFSVKYLYSLVNMLIRTDTFKFLTTWLFTIFFSVLYVIKRLSIPGNFHGALYTTQIDFNDRKSNSIVPFQAYVRSHIRQGMEIKETLRLTKHYSFLHKTSFCFLFVLFCFNLFAFFVGIRVRIGPQHPLACRKRRPNGDA